MIERNISKIITYYKQLMAKHTRGDLFHLKRNFYAAHILIYLKYVPQSSLRIIQVENMWKKEINYIQNIRCWVERNQSKLENCNLKRSRLNIFPTNSWTNGVKIPVASKQLLAQTFKPCNIFLFELLKKINIVMGDFNHSLWI